VAEAPPESVAVSEIDPPRRTEPDAWVVKVGAAIAAEVVASALLFSVFGSFDAVTVATFV
jgi:hypothetical protein